MRIAGGGRLAVAELVHLRFSQNQRAGLQQGVDGAPRAAFEEAGGELRAGPCRQPFHEEGVHHAERRTEERRSLRVAQQRSRISRTRLPTIALCHQSGDLFHPAQKPDCKRWRSSLPEAPPRSATGL